MSDILKLPQKKLLKSSCSQHIIELFEIIYCRENLLPDPELANNNLRLLSPGYLCKCKFSHLLQILYVPDISVIIDPNPGEKISNIPFNKISHIFIVLISILSQALFDEGILLLENNNYKRDEEMYEQCGEEIKRYMTKNKWSEEISKLSVESCKCSNLSSSSYSVEHLSIKLGQHTSNISKKNKNVPTTQLNAPNSKTSQNPIELPTTSTQPQMSNQFSNRIYFNDSQLQEMNSFINQNSALSFKELYTNKDISPSFYTHIASFLPKHLIRFKSYLTPDVCRQPTLLFSKLLISELEPLTAITKETDNWLVLMSDLFYKLGYQQAINDMRNKRTNQENLEDLLKESIRVTTDNQNALTKVKSHIIDNKIVMQLDTILDDLKTVKCTVDNIARGQGLQGYGGTYNQLSLTPNQLKATPTQQQGNIYPNLNTLNAIPSAMSQSVNARTLPTTGGTFIQPYQHLPTTSTQTNTNQLVKLNQLSGSPPRRGVQRFD